MIDENPFFTFDEVKEEILSEVKIPKPKKQKSPIVIPTIGPVEKIMVNRTVHPDGTVTTAWADKNTIHPDALHFYEKYKEFY